MPVLDVTKNLDALTLTVTAEFAADPERVWRLYEDPRRLERWWGPPGYPATFLRHELRPGGGSHYFMRGPEGDEHHGVWSVVDVDAPRAFTVDDAFADAAGTPNTALPTMRLAITLTAGGAGTVLTSVSTFASAEALQQTLDMGIEEGLRGAMAQIDGILAEESA
ncbi:MAG: SRPBCC domain-containing protein [Micrococcales bacterium]|nr:SRPBCC domain-containing protein [Micrococcales bacterium]